MPRTHECEPFVKQLHPDPVFNGSGAMEETYRYDAFGKVTVTNASTTATADSSFYGNRFLYTGREWIAEAGLYDYRNRVYSAALGRFMQTDPILFEAGDVNVYRYVGNAVIIFIDPFGLELVFAGGGPQVNHGTGPGQSTGWAGFAGTDGTKITSISGSNQSDRTENNVPVYDTSKGEGKPTGDSGAQVVFREPTIVSVNYENKDGSKGEAHMEFNPEEGTYSMIEGKCPKKEDNLNLVKKPNKQQPMKQVKDAVPGF